MKVVAVIALCIVGAFGKPNYAVQPDIRIETLPAAVPIARAYNHQPEIVVASPPLATYGAGVRTIAPAIGIVRQHMTSDAAGNYNMNLEGSDGTVQVESGSLKNLGNPEGLSAVKEGSYSWTSPEGQRFTVTYTADERGFLAQGAHLPTPPPMPEEIRQSLLIPRVATAAVSAYGYSAPAVVATPAVQAY